MRLLGRAKDYLRRLAPDMNGVNETALLLQECVLALEKKNRPRKHKLTKRERELTRLNPEHYNHENRDKLFRELQKALRRLGSE